MIDSPAVERTHVLVVDDEPHVGRIIQMKLEQGPFRVTLAYDGIEASVDSVANLFFADGDEQEIE